MTGRYIVARSRRKPERNPLKRPRAETAASMSASSIKLAPSEFFDGHVRLPRTLITLPRSSGTTGRSTRRRSRHFPHRPKPAVVISRRIGGTCFDPYQPSRSWKRDIVTATEEEDGHNSDGMQHAKTPVGCRTRVRCGGQMRDPIPHIP
jgi:hypothetical protein